MESDTKFQGGGTPIGSIIPQQQPPQQQPPQMQQQQPQMQQPPQHQQPPQMQRQQMQLPMQRQQMQPPMQRQQMQPSKVDNFQEAMGFSVAEFFVLVGLICIINSPFVINLEKTLLPVFMRGGEPPVAIIILNAFIAVLLYIGIEKYLIKKIKT